MEIKRSGTQPSTKGPSEYFTGSVRIDPLFSPPDPARVAMALVTFEPGAYCLAYTPLRPDPHSHGRFWLGAARRRSHRADTSGRCSMVRSAGEALAWGDLYHCHEPYRHSGETQRFACRLDGACL